MNDQFGNRRHNNNDKRFDRYRRYGEQNNFRFPSEHPHEGGKRKKNDKAMLSENLQSIKKSLELISTNLSRLVEAIERRSQAEERQASAIESLQTQVEGLVQEGAPRPVEDGGAPPAADPEPVGIDMPEEEGVDGRAADRNGSLQSIILSLREQGLSFEKIARNLAEQEIPTPSGRGKWRGQTVQRIYRQAAR